MKRRAFLKLGAIGGGVAATATLPATMSKAESTQTATDFALTIAPATAEMIDGLMVYVLGFFLGLDEASPVLRVKEGDQITITVTNNDTRPHNFYVPGMRGSAIGTMQPGETGTTTFVARNPGTYLYLDPSLAPLNRLLGLHGCMIVEPIDGRTPAGSETPYAAYQHTQQVRAIFDAMGGGHPRFPGTKWLARDLSREKIWLFSQVDPSLNERIAAGEDVDPARLRDSFLPRYFTINGLSGFDTAVHDNSTTGHDRARRIMPSGRQGEPCLIRTLNAGLATHAMHIHGNHFLELSESDRTGINRCETHVYERDVVMLSPLERIDLLLPFERPPDIPPEAWPPREEPFPLRYVMHCHFELSQTAGGGNYPQGAVTHWEMTAPL